MDDTNPLKEVRACARSKDAANRSIITARLYNHNTSLSVRPVYATRTHHSQFIISQLALYMSSSQSPSYVKSIVEDTQWLIGEAAFPGEVLATSGYFDEIHECATELVKAGLAYVDSSSPEVMRELRGTLTEPGRDSPDRSRSVEDNLRLFVEMAEGKVSLHRCFALQAQESLTRFAHLTAAPHRLPDPPCQDRHVLPQLEPP